MVAAPNFESLALIILAVGVGFYPKLHGASLQLHGVKRRMISVVNFFVFLRLLLFALLLLYVT